MENNTESTTPSPRGRRNMKYIYIFVIISAVYHSYMGGNLGVSCVVIALTTLAWITSNMRNAREIENPRKIMKIGLDIHGVCDANPAFFQELTRLFVSQGHEVIIITGRMKSHGALEELEELGISYTKFYSIVDFHKEKGTEIRYDEKGNPWIDDDVWNKTKSEICEKEKIDFHIDDSSIYGEYFITPYAQIIVKKD